MGLSKLVISRVIITVTPLRARITLLITYLLSPLPLQLACERYRTLNPKPKTLNPKPKTLNPKP